VLCNRHWFNRVRAQLYVCHPSGPNPRCQSPPPRSAKNRMCAASTGRPQERRNAKGRTLGLPASLPSALTLTLAVPCPPTPNLIGFPGPVTIGKTRVFPTVTVSLLLPRPRTWGPPSQKSHTKYQDFQEMRRLRTLEHRLVRGTGSKMGVYTRDQSTRPPRGTGRYAFENTLRQESPALGLVCPDPP
jgi:hypothetical protein